MTSLNQWIKRFEERTCLHSTSSKEAYFQQEAENRKVWALWLSRSLHFLQRWVVALRSQQIQPDRRLISESWQYAMILKMCPLLQFCLYLGFNQQRSFQQFWGGMWSFWSFILKNVWSSGCRLSDSEPPRREAPLSKMKQKTGRMGKWDGPPARSVCWTLFHFWVFPVSWPDVLTGFDRSVSSSKITHC